MIEETNDEMDTLSPALLSAMGFTEDASGEWSLTLKRDNIEEPTEPSKEVI
jgi:hypothetical protein